MNERDQLQGKWRRLILSRPGETVDCTTSVSWLQGPAFFIDLRQPVNIVNRIAANCLAELTIDEAASLATQDGFAGEFAISGGVAEWRHEIDFHSPGPIRDRATLVHEGDLLIEHGLESDYMEYWQRSPVLNDLQGASARLRCLESGRSAFLVQHGRHFAYARDRGSGLPPGCNLHDILGTSCPKHAQDLVDCEISFGTITSAGWQIVSSTLPWRIGSILIEEDALEFGDRFCISDIDAHGRPMARHLAVIQAYGDFVPFPARHFLEASPRHTARTSAPFSAVPVINVAAIDSGDDAAERLAVEHLRKAAAKVGFFHVTGHGIAPTLFNRLQDAAQRFFALPAEEKMQSYIGWSTNHRGYVPEGEEEFGYGSDGRKRDRKEAFDLALDLGADVVPPGHPMLGPNQWPDMAGFREDVMAYYSAVFELGRKLLHGFALALGKPASSFDHLVTTPPSQLRLIHYPYDPDAVDVQGIGAHTDYECFTLLLATSPGLEVMNGAGQWIDAPPVEGGLIVNIGDMLEYWSGGKFVATSHRVRKVAEERYSFPLFFAVDYDVEISPLHGNRQGSVIHSGEHLFAQTAQTFRYLKERARRGELTMPGKALPLSSFGQEHRHRNSNLV